MERVVLEIREKQLTFSLKPSVLSRLEMLVNEVSSGHIPGCGGIFLGRRNADQPGSVYIDDCFPVAAPKASEHGGEGGRLLDPWLLKQAIDLWQCRADASLYAVGQYRIALDSGHKALDHLSWEDFAPNDVLFDIRVGRPVTLASVYIIAANRGPDCTPDLEIPFRDLRSLAVVRPDSGSKPDEAHTSVQGYHAVSPAVYGEAQTGKRMVSATVATTMGVGIFLLAVLGIAASHRNTLAARPNDTVADTNLLLGLRPVRTVSGWDVHWNPKSAVMNSAYRGELTVSDSLVRRRIEITPADLGVGRLLYVSDANDLTFELEVFARDGRGVSDSVRVGRTASTNEAGIPAYVDHAGKMPRLLPETLGRGVQHFIPSTSDHVAPQRTATKTTPPYFDALQTSKPDHRPNIGDLASANSDSVRSETPPPPARVLQVQPVTKPGATSNLAPAPTTDGPSTARNTLAPIAETLMPPSLPRPPPFAQPKPRERKSTLVAPAIISRSAATYPEVAKSLKIAGTVRLDVTIGKKGELLGVTNVSGPLLLQTAAITSAKRWQFAPATVNGTPVEAPLTIFVNFQLRD